MNIRVDLTTPITDGTEVVFRSPVDCSQITGLIVYYNDDSKEFTLADAHGNNVGDIDHLFAENVVVKVILDVTHSMAYVQNADTNAYIERTFVKSVNGTVPDKTGGVTVPTGLKVTITRNPYGSYGADHDPDLIRKAIEENRTVVCYWYDKNIMLHLTSFQLSGPYIFTVVEGAMEYRGVIRDTDDIVCTETNLLQEAVLYTPQTLTPEQQAQARQNIGIPDLPTEENNSYRLIAKIVFDETNLSDAIVITQDMDGNPLELTKLVMYADWQAHEEGRSDAYLSINNGTKLPYICSVEKTAYKHIVTVDAFDGFYYLHIAGKIVDKSSATAVADHVNTMTGSKINHILWYVNKNREPPVGSVLTVYGY